MQVQAATMIVRVGLVRRTWRLELDRRCGGTRVSCTARRTVRGSVLFGNRAVCKTVRREVGPVER